MMQGNINASPKKPLYKYRKLDKHTFEMFINREVYFSNVPALNDPFDCQISINEFLDWKNPNMKDLLNESAKELISKLEPFNIFKRLEELVSSCGIFSMSGKSDDVTMWSHYANNHEGLCVGFYTLPKIIGGAEYPILKIMNGYYQCEYLEKSKYPIVETMNSKTLSEFDMVSGIGQKIGSFLFNRWATLKSEEWEYEDEVRGIRYAAGFEKYEPSMIGEVIFGLKMDDKDKQTIRTLLSGPDWHHVKFKRAERNRYGFGFTLVEDKGE
jgi:hypothetical protein